ncbi:MAG: hypothetical protein ACC651_12760 [Candidatus Scalindua sp.]
MKFTDNEIRDITRYLEEGKPLPEKYRFLLFEEKREVELVWNGKTNEVCNVVLPFQVIEQVDEPRSEKELSLQAELFDMQTGRQIKGWNNKLIWGDNKLILSSLKNGPLREEVILECRQKHITRVDILGFEFEMGLFPNILDEAKSKGIDLAMKYILRDVFDKRAVEKNQVVFHDVSFIEVKPLIKKNSIAVELTDFSVFYSQDSQNADENLKNGKSRVIVDQGQVVKISKDKKGIISREVLTKHWTDWIDYWSVDFDFESKREIVRVNSAESGETEEVWTGDFVFENEWQSFRTKKDRSIELKSAFHECQPGRRKIAVKVVDIFGNDTMKVIEVII